MHIPQVNMEHSQNRTLSGPQNKTLTNLKNWNHTKSSCLIRMEFTRKSILESWWKILNIRTKHIAK